MLCFVPNHDTEASEFATVLIWAFWLSLRRSFKENFENGKWHPAPFGSQLWFPKLIQSLTLCQMKWGTVSLMCLMKCKSDPACVSVQVGETSVVNVDCTRAGPGQLSLEDALDSSPTSPTGSGNTTNIHTISCKLTYWWLYMFQPITYKSHTTFQVIH